PDLTSDLTYSRSSPRLTTSSPPQRMKFSQPALADRGSGRLPPLQELLDPGLDVLAPDGAHIGRHPPLDEEASKAVSGLAVGADRLGDRFPARRWRTKLSVSVPTSLTIWVLASVLMARDYPLNERY